MTSTSVFFGPGGATTSVTRQIINRQAQSGKNPTCACLPPSSNKKSYDNSYINNEGQLINSQIIVDPYNRQTQSERVATIIRSHPGGKVQYGNPGIAQSTTFLGRTAGQPGGIIGTLRIRNKFWKLKFFVER